ncbi:catecholate siderophore receptor Fiu [Derxia gummosa]|uniref:Catecholate siderophore receptor Fiu n=1 Tax=Derxia gummosa DSM 723 TaxID=1121388 RepID=A0A8B6X4V3_9BURK|nr:catecholate siderophore receptor Fiu [Derxia gummosa]
MAIIKSRKHAAASSLAFAAPAVGLLLGAALPATSLAQSAGNRGDAATLPAISVKGERESDYKVEKSASAKATAPLLDTPRTQQVITKEVLQEQGAATLMDALRNTPGITMQLGENGNSSAGDAFYMRGFSTQTSTFVDGIRDLGAVTRDVFNLEQVEVVRGPSGSDSGRGSASGYINLISKLPGQDDFVGADFTAGTANQKRVTADVNKSFANREGALRLNVMTQDSDVPGRDEVKNKGTAIAPSVAFGLGTPSRVYLYSQHVRQDNVPDGGIPTIGMKGFYNSALAGLNPAKVDRSNYYGGKGDYEKVDADMVSLKFEHDFGADARVTSLTRYGKTHMDRVMTGINALTITNVADPSTWTVARTRQRVDQTNEILANQTTLKLEGELGGLRHSFAGGFELMYERQKTLGFGTTAQTINGSNYTAVTITPASLYSPNSGDALGIPYATGANTEGKVTTTALYLFDTLHLSEEWKLSLGGRLERYDLTTNSGTIVTGGSTGNSATYPGYAVGSIAPTSLSKAENLFSWNAGLVYKPVPEGSIYIATANSYTPPGSANFTLSSTTTNQASPTLDPQETTHYEVGTKWELLDRRLNVNAAAYRTTNDKQTSYDAATNETRQFGKTRVQGVELSAVGQITNFWQVTAGVSKMDTKALDSYSRNTTTGVVTSTTGVRWSPDWSATLWTSYTLDAFTLGGGATYMSKLQRSISSGDVAGQTNLPEIDGYTVFNLMGAWRVNRNLNLRLNVYNLFDKEYVMAPNNSGARIVLGAPRYATVTASLMF